MSRNQFTFYKSFDDTFDFLNDEQTLSYLKVLRDVQFLRVRVQDVVFNDPMLNGIWRSTKHTFETSIKGYLDSQLSEKVKIPFFGCYSGYNGKFTPFDSPLDTPLEGGREQVKGKGKEQSKEQVKEQVKVEHEIPSETEVKYFAVEYSKKHIKDKQQCIDLALRGWSNYRSNDWKDVNGKAVKNWKTKLSNSYLSLDKLKDSVSDSQLLHDNSLTWLIQGNRKFEDMPFCLMAYNSDGAKALEKEHLGNVLKHKGLL